MSTTTTTRNHRARWAAIGAAIAVSVGAGGIGIANATTPSDASTLIPIEPCRIADTRPTQRIGLTTSAFGPGETHTVATRGSNTGRCDPLPSGITAVALNVTAVGASAPTHLTFWASGLVPNSSSLNPAPGQPPTPNAVTTDVAADGSFRVFNFAGNVQLIIDVVGYYTDHDHDDRHYTKDQSNNRYYTKAETDDRHDTKAETDDVLANLPTTKGGTIAYAWNDLTAPMLNTAVALTTPFLYNPSGEPVTVTRTATGRYTIVFEGLDMSSGHVQVTDYGNTTNDCKVSFWSAAGILVRCHTPAGADVNSSFTVMFIDRPRADE